MELEKGISLGKVKYIDKETGEFKIIDNIRIFGIESNPMGFHRYFVNNFEVDYTNYIRATTIALNEIKPISVEMINIFRKALHTKCEVNFVGNHGDKTRERHCDLCEYNFICDPEI